MPEILFVCTANQFRSPIAAACFVRKLQEKGIPGSWTVTSAGTWTRDGYSAHPAALREATRLGLDLSQHRSREVNAVILESADLVIVMEVGHREALVIEFPQSDGKVALLSELAGDVPVDVIDPFHSAFEDSTEVANVLSQYVDAAFEIILSKASANATGRKETLEPVLPVITTMKRHDYNLKWLIPILAGIVMIACSVFLWNGSVFGKDLPEKTRGGSACLRASRNPARPCGFR